MLARRMERVSSSPIMDLIKTTAAGNYLSFASGLPDAGLFPVETLQAIADDVLDRDGRAALQYGPAEGFPPLREYVASLLRKRGLPATPEHVLITTGSQQALDLAARALLNDGDRVLVENPTYLAALQAFDSFGARYEPVPLDREGIEVERAGEVLQTGPHLFYTLPNFQNPTGITMSTERRERLAVAAVNARVPVLEDDAYHDLAYDGEPPRPLVSLAENPFGVYTGTFSKVIAPGLRIGYLYAPPALTARLGQLKQITDLHAGSLTQRIVFEFCARGQLEPAIARLRDAYRARRDVLLDALEQHVTGLAEWTRPRGGMFVFVRLPAGRDAGELLRACMEQGIVFVPGASFHPDGSGTHTFRLNFVSLDEPRSRQGIEILGRGLRELAR